MQDEAISGTISDSGLIAPDIKPVILAPTYNNAGTLAGVLARIDALSIPTIVVDDGSTDSTPDTLRAWAASRRDATVIRHPVNRGKAAALRTGFERAANAGFTHAVTIDTDGQHDPEQIPDLLAAAKANPQALILGIRSGSIEGYPAKSRAGRHLSNLFIRMESGAIVEDSQSGFRVYPLGLVRTVRSHSGHFGFETEILTRAVWAECPIVEVPIRSRYFPPGERVTHFRPWLDTLRAIAMHLRLLGRELLPIPHRRWPGTHAHDERSWWRGLLSWLSPRRVWRDIHEDPDARATVATGLSLGVFVANTPLPFLHQLIALYLAKRLHLHPLPVLAGTALGLPPLGPLLIVAAIWLGFVITHGHPPHGELLRPEGGLSWHWFKHVVGEWWLGSTIIGLAMAFGTFALVKLFLRRVPLTPHPASPGVPEGSGQSP